MSSTTRFPTDVLLPWPGQWGTSALNKRPLAIAVVFMAGALIGPFYTYSALSEDDWYGAAFGVMITVACVLMASIGSVMMRARRKNFAASVRLGGGEANGIEFRIQKARRYVLLAFPVVGLAFFVVRGMVVAGYISSGDAGRTVLNWLQLVAMAALALLMVLLLPVLRGLVNSRLVFTAEMIFITDMGARRELSWSDIESVRAILENESPVIRVTPRSGSGIRRIGSYPYLVRFLRASPESLDIHNMYPIDFSLLLHVIDFYARHPEARSELGTPTAIQRMSRGDLIS